MNRLIPAPPPTPVITIAPGTSLGPTAVTAPPGKPSLEPPPRRPRERRKIPKALFFVVGGAVLAAAGGLAAWMQSEPIHVQIVSGRTSPKVTASGQKERWWAERITLSLDKSLDKLGGEGEDAAAHAFGAWVSSGAKVPAITFNARPAAPILDEPDGDNRVYYAPIQFPGHENDLAITLAFTNEDTGEIVEADVILNSRHRFGVLADEESGEGTRGHGDEGRSGNGNRREGTSDGSESGDDDEAQNSRSGPGSDGEKDACRDVYDVTSVLTHEAGHFFGLAEDTTDSKATMFFSTRPCDIGKRDLGSDDSAVLTALYAAAPEGEEPEGAARACSVTSVGAGAPGRGTVLAAFAGLAALGRTRRRAPRERAPRTAHCSDTCSPVKFV